MSTLTRSIAPVSAARQPRGFTLLELLVAISVMAVLTAVAVPALRSWVHQRAIQAEVEEFQSALRRARMTAVHRGARVTLCGRGADVAGRPACSDDDQAWSKGWVLFIDHGEAGRVESEDVVLAEHQASGRVGAVEASTPYLSFHPIGVATNAASRFRFLPPGAQAGQTDVAGARLVCVNKPGRPRVSRLSQCS